MSFSACLTNAHTNLLTVVECGRVQPILKGEVIYVNSTTYLSSEINYSCGTGYKLIGNKARTCQEDGRWSGVKPKCEGLSDGNLHYNCPASN